jgi:fatty-acyl-CoA synthase
MRSAGKALPGIELAILDADGKRLPPGEVGEIATRSGSNMVGYWNLPEATARTLDSEGWLRTGDAGYMDSDGYLYIHDRIKDMIISGGENIYPAEVESAICDHPDVAEVAVVGVPDDKWGEAVKAIVVMKPARRRRRRISSISPRTYRRLQDAEVGRFHRGPAPQRLGQDPAPQLARSLLGWARTGR